MRIIQDRTVLTIPAFHFLALRRQLKITYTNSVFSIRIFTENDFVNCRHGSLSAKPPSLQLSRHVTSHWRWRQYTDVPVVVPCLSVYTQPSVIRHSAVFDIAIRHAIYNFVLRAHAQSKITLLARPTTTSFQKHYSYLLYQFRTRIKRKRG
jgi:hypothetical protein